MAVGTRLRWRLVTATVLHRSTSNNESGDGLCLSKIGRDRVEPLRRFTRFLPWSEAASRALVERPGSLWPDAVVASLLLGAVFGRLPKGSGFQNGLLSKVGRLFGWFVPRGFPRTNHPLHLASADGRFPNLFHDDAVVFCLQSTRARSRSASRYFFL